MTVKRRVPLSRWLTLLVLGTALPLLAFAILTLVWLVGGYRADQDRRQADTARALALAVDGEVHSWKAAVTALAASKALERGRLADFYEEARALAAQHDGWVVLTVASGEQLLNTLRPYGSPHAMTSSLETIDAIFATGRPVVSDVFYGHVTQGYLVAVGVPVLHGGKVVNGLTLNFAPRRLTDLLHSQRFPASWVAAINDRQHQVVARSPHIDQRIGKPVVSWLAAVVDTAESGIATGPLMDGRPGQIAFQRLREAPWTVNVAVPVAELEAAWRRPVLGFLLLGGFAALAAVGVALGLGRRIARPVTEAAHVAAGVIHGQAPTLPPSHIAEVAALQAALGDGAATVRAALQAREGAAAALREANATLEARVTERTRALEQANEALQKGNVELETASSELQETNVQLEEVNAELTHEIEGRGRAEAALRASEARLQLFIENAPAAIAMFDRDLCYLSASRRWRTDYGLGDRDLTGQSHYGILPEIPEAWKTVHRRGLAGEVVRAAEDCFTRQDGTVQWLSWEVRPWRTEDGAVGGIIIFTEDITERKRAEEALRTTLAQKDAALADKDALLREVHHRVKNNLQMLCDLMYLQMEAMPDRDQHQDLQDAYSRIYAIARLHEQIYQSMHSGQIQLAEYLRRVVSGFANLYPNVPVAVEAASVEVLIDLDRAIHVGLVVNELLTNAVKHAFPDGQPGQVSVAVCAAGDQIFLQVRDNGRGLPADLDLEHATSLGLRTVHILARRLEAKVTVSSSGGTSFTLTFPVRYDPPLEPA